MTKNTVSSFATWKVVMTAITIDGVRAEPPIQSICGKASPKSIWPIEWVNYVIFEAMTRNFIVESSTKYISCISLSYFSDRSIIEDNILIRKPKYFYIV